MDTQIDEFETDETDPVVEHEKELEEERKKQQRKQSNA